MVNYFHLKTLPVFCCTQGYSIFFSCFTETLDMFLDLSSSFLAKSTESHYVSMAVIISFLQ